MTIELESFLFKEENSRTKESLVNYRLFYDLKLAAALRGYDLSLYTSDVDRDGFDIILDDQDSVRKIQLKTVLKNATTSTWHIHKTMLRPDVEFCEYLGFEPTQSGTGVQGGVILMELDPQNDSMAIRYYYTDVFVITALYLNIVNRNPKIRSTIFDSFYQNIRDGVSNEKMPVPKSLFIEAKGPEHLLGLMALHNRISYGWRHNLISIGKDHFFHPIDDSVLPAPKTMLKESIADELIKLTEGLVKPKANTRKSKSADHSSLLFCATGDVERKRLLSD